MIFKTRPGASDLDEQEKSVDANEAEPLLSPTENTEKTNTLETNTAFALKT